MNYKFPPAIRAKEKRISFNDFPFLFFFLSFLSFSLFLSFFLSFCLRLFLCLVLNSECFSNLNQVLVAILFSPLFNVCAFFYLALHYASNNATIESTTVTASRVSLLERSAALGVSLSPSWAPAPISSLNSCHQKPVLHPSTFILLSYSLLSPPGRPPSVRDGGACCMPIALPSIA